MKHANYKWLYETKQFQDHYIEEPRVTEHLACGEFVAKMYEEVSGKKIPFIRNILAPKKKVEKVLHLITCSRIEDEQKGWSRMKKMCDMMDYAKISYEWIVFSVQPDGKIPDHVHFIKPTFNIYPYLADATYNVLLSNAEGLPMQVLEALQYQIPSIVTDIGGCTELIQDGVNGYVVPLDMNFDIEKIKKIPKLKEYKGTTANDWTNYLGDALYEEKPLVEEKENMMTIKAITDYTDTKYPDRTGRLIEFDVPEGHIYTVDEDRAKEIIKADLAVVFSM